MATEKQIEAARLNGAKSKGPVTEEGKAVSSQNARKHGLSARKYILDDEDQEEFDALHAEYRATFAPANRIEADLVRQITIYQFRLDRAIRLSVCASDIEGLNQDEILTAEFENVDPDLILSCAVIEQHHNGKAEAFFRYENHYSRLFNRALKNLRALQRDRRMLENQHPPAAPEPPLATKLNEPKAEEPRLYSINEIISSGHIPSLKPQRRSIPFVQQNEPDQSAKIPDLGREHTDADLAA